MKKETIEIAINKSYLVSLEATAKMTGITIDEAVQRAFMIYIGSYALDDKVRVEFYKKIVRATDEKRNN